MGNKVQVMVSTRQIDANRQNALKSTGPRSATGKSRSSQNALTHGLTAKRPLLPGEDPEEYDALRHAVFDRFKPEDEVETLLVDRIASLFWRLRRVPVFEAALFEWVRHDQTASDDDVLENFLEIGRPKLSGDNQELGEMGRTLHGLLLSDLTNKLTRYEIALQHQLTVTLKELREYRTISHSSEVSV